MKKPHQGIYPSCTSYFELWKQYNLINKARWHHTPTIIWQWHQFKNHNNIQNFPDWKLLVRVTIIIDKLKNVCNTNYKY